MSDVAKMPKIANEIGKARYYFMRIKGKYIDVLLWHRMSLVKGVVRYLRSWGSSLQINLFFFVNFDYMHILSNLKRHKPHQKISV